MKETLTSAGTEEDFQQWTKKAINEIANCSSFIDLDLRYQKVWSESYKRLTDKAGCNLDTLVKNAKNRAKANGATKAKVNAISKVSVIAANKRLKEIYISVIREMMIAYCVEVA